MSTPQPVRIVGGGVAGLSLGIALRRAEIPTEIFEAGDYPRHRVCGEFIAGLSDDTIKLLGIRPIFAGAVVHRSVTWFVQERPVGRQKLPSPALGLSRFALDDRLATLFVAEGGILSVKTRFKSTTPEEGVVWACGHRNGEGSPWLGLKLHARDLTVEGGLELHLGEGAYVGLSSVEDGWVNVCGLFRRRRCLSFARGDALSAYLVACGLDALAERLESAKIRPESRCAVAGLSFDQRVKEDVHLRLGDACAMTPPFTGNGMAMAFTSASLAVAPLVRWARGEQTWATTKHKIHELLRDKFRVRLVSAATLHPFLTNRTLQSPLKRIKHAELLPLTTLYRLTH
ncbi:MAG: hypothetical protein QM715_01630 [Nibricoccus sp.]